MLNLDLFLRVGGCDGHGAPFQNEKARGLNTRSLAGFGKANPLGGAPVMLRRSVSVVIPAD